MKYTKHATTAEMAELYVELAHVDGKASLLHLNLQWRAFGDFVAVFLPLFQILQIVLNGLASLVDVTGPIARSFERTAVGFGPP